MANDNALSFVGKINDEHKLVLKADGEALRHAIECGKALALAEENVLSTKPKGKWLRWLEEHCPDIHRNTAALYMRLAENEDKIADCTSIRDADVKLRQSNDDEDDDESDSDADESDAEEVTDEEADEAAQRVVQAGNNADLADLLQALAVDELYTVLTRSWERDQLADLHKRLGEISNRRLQCRRLSWALGAPHQHHSQANANSLRRSRRNLLPLIGGSDWRRWATIPISSPIMGGANG
jgi:hypothetical protein